MGLRLQTVQAEAAQTVGDHKSAVFQVQPHARDARLASIALAVVVAVRVHIANQKATVAEHTRQHLHHGAAFVAELGQWPGAGGLGAVDAIALQCAGADPHAVAEGEQGAVVDRAHVEHQRRAGAPFGLGQRRAVEPGCPAIDARTAAQVGKAGRQLVGNADAAEQLAADVLDLHLVVHKLAQLDGLARGGLLDEKAGARVGIQRDIEVHRLADRGDRESAAVGARRVDHTLGWQQARRQGGREGIRGWRHHQQPVDTRGDQREPVFTVGSGRQHARCGCRTVGQKDPRRAPRVAAVAGAGDVDQGHHGTGQRRAGLAVEDHTERVDQQAGL